MSEVTINNDDSFDSRTTFEKRFEGWIKLIESIKSQGNVGQVIIATSYFDFVLRNIIESYFIKGRINKDMFDNSNSFLATFSSKINIAYTVGVLSPWESKTLHTMRKIRNVFAHEVGASFKSTSVIKYMTPLTKEFGSDYGAEGAFLLAVQKLSMNLLNRSDHAEANRLIEREWPTRRVDFVESDGYDLD